MQKIIVNAELSTEAALEIITRWAAEGFSVSSKQTEGRWTIAAMRLINPDLEKKADRVAESMGIYSPIGKLSHPPGDE